MTKIFQSTNLLYLLLITVCLTLFLPGIKQLPLTDRDSALFAQTSKQMLETGNYVTLKFQEEFRHKKPPGIYWLQTGLVKIISPHHFEQVWPYLIASTLGALISVLLCFSLTKTIIGTKPAFLGCLFLASSLLLIIEAHMITTDAVLLTTIILMQCCLWHCYTAYRQQRAPANTYINLFWLALNLGILVKGISPIVSILCIATLCITDRDVNFIKQLKPLRGLIFTLVFTSAWLLVMSIFSHRNFLYDMVSVDFFPKIISAQESHGAPPFYYLLLTPLLFWPASLFLVLGIAYAWHNRNQDQIKFLLAWLLPYFIVFSFIPTKLPQYVLPIFPPLALLTSLAIYDKKFFSNLKFDKTALTITSMIWLLVCLLFGIALVVAHQLFSDHPQHYISAVSLLLIGSSLILFYLVNTQRLLIASYGVIFLTLAVIPAVFNYELPDLNRLWISEKLYEVVVDQLALPISSTDPLYTTYYQEPSMIFKLGTKNVVFIDSPSAINNIISKHHGYVLIAQQEWPQWDIAMKQNNLSVEELREIHGFHYSKGRWVNLILLKIA